MRSNSLAGFGACSLKVELWRYISSLLEFSLCARHREMLREISCGGCGVYVLLFLQFSNHSTGLQLQFTRPADEQMFKFVSQNEKK